MVIFRSHFVAISLHKPLHSLVTDIFATTIGGEVLLGASQVGGCCSTASVMFGLQKDAVSIGRDVSIGPSVSPHFLAVG